MNRTQIPHTSAANRFRISTRNLLAGAVAFGVAGGIATPAFLSTVNPALADPVRVEGAQVVPGFSEVVSVVSPAVVSVRVEGRAAPQRRDRSERRSERRNPVPEQFRGTPFEDFFRDFGDRGEQFSQRQRPQQPRFRASQGSGFFISEDGLVVTNNHVVAGGDQFTIVLNDGEEIEAELIGTDPRTDLAVLKAKQERDYVYVDFADQTGARVGDWVVAVGNPFGLGGTVTAGIVSGIGRDIGSGPYDDFLQIDAAVNRGNSGGPAFNLSGEVIGVNTAIFSPSGGNVGIAFAIPASTTKAVVAELVENGAVERGWLGVQIQPVTEELAEAVGLEDAIGAIVADATEDGPAEVAGLETGDIVLSVNDQQIENPKDLATTIAAFDPGSTADIQVWRDGASKTIAVELGELPDASVQRAALGERGSQNLEKMEDMGLDLMRGDGGELVIENVDPSSEAARRGFRQGDIVEKVNGTDVSNVNEVAAAVAAAAEAGRDVVLFQLRNERGTRFSTLPIEDAG
ncbi:MAG: Do family serine endopeptidase [Pseudomonadota bacterium]